ncbi:MAG: efflux RND transporter permease subunit [Micavibrio sp.]|nr:efflux RND transporter permease subunit [Micavibrio sp.]
MWIVRIALERPYTFIVLALMLLVIGPLTIMRTPTDIFPNIGIPVVSVVFSYTGLPPDEMGNRITSTFERVVSTTVNDIEHIESQSLTGVSVIKLFFQPGVNIDLSMSQVTAVAQTMLKSLPPGTTPPLILSYNASSVPVLQLALSSKSLPEQDLFDYSNNFVRTQLASVPGAAMPFPFGGKTRQIQVDLDPRAMQAHNISAQDVNAAISAQNLILPAGTQKIGDYEYNVKLNASPLAADALNDLPIKTRDGATLYVRDVAHVRDGFAPQTNIVRVDGQRAVLMSIQKTGNSSTLSIVERVKSLLGKIREDMPDAMDLKSVADQSIFVKASISGVIHEGVIAAALTALMILLFLGSWRSTLIIVVSIPLSVLASIIALSALGETINIMTLGGLALAVGILVDDATVAIENINWHLEQGKEVTPAILDGAQQIAVPALVSTLCICIVFVPMFFLTGVPRYLFTPMAEAVVFAMLASYILSRTLIPTLAMYLLKPHAHKEAKRETTRNPFITFQHAFEKRFEAFRDGYTNNLSGLLGNAGLFIVAFLLFLGVSMGTLGPWLGSDFFPSVDGGQIKLHMRAPSGIRVEQTARIADAVEDTIRSVIPANDMDSLIDNIGLPISGINLSYSTSAPIGPGDADIMISLKDGHKPTADYVSELRKVLAEKHPDITFAFLPADIVSQILNFGLPSPIDIQVRGRKVAENSAYVHDLYNKIRRIPGIVDARIQQTSDYPELRVNVDRSRAQDVGLTQRDVATNMLISMSGSFQTSPNFWLSPQNGVSYPIVTQVPQYKMDSLESLRNLPVGNGGGSANPQSGQILGALSTINRGVGTAVISHYNVQPTFDIFASVQGRDLGAVGKDVDAAIAGKSADMPKGSTVEPREQMLTQQQSFTGLYQGLIFAIALVYLLMVVNFQSWVDPFIIIMALPAALAGIVWMLFLISTTLSVPALTGGHHVHGRCHRKQHPDRQLCP